MERIAPFKIQSESNRTYQVNFKTILMKKVALKIPLHLDSEAAKSLQSVKSITHQSTNTKAITEALHGFVRYKRNYEKALETIERLNLELEANKRATRNFLQCFEELKAINETKQNATTKNTKGKKNLQLSID